MPAKKETAASTTKKTPVKRSVATKTPVKSTARATTAKTVAAKTKTPSVKKVVAANARHIEENSKTIENNSKLIHLLYGSIIVLMMIIAALAFYVGTMYGKPQNVGGDTPTSMTQSQDITITVIDDTRCTSCQTEGIVTQLRELPFLAGANIIEKDFSDAGVADFMTENNLTNIPAVIFSTNAINDGGQIVPFLSAINDEEFSLALPESFDPFATRSAKGFLVLDSMETIEAIKTNAKIDGNPEAPITWIEYSDLECPFCAKLHNEGTTTSIMEKYGDDVNVIFQHFPLEFHPNAQKAAEALECIADQNGDVYHDIIAASYAKYNNNNFSLEGFYDIASENGIDRDALVSCTDSGGKTDIVKAQMAAGQTLFGITGTPGNAIINNATGEYEVISGAYPASAFEEIIDVMLAE